MNIAINAGHILLENGAEISRVEETMDTMATSLGVEEKSFFVLSNGFIATSGSYSKASFIPIKGTQLSRVAEVNRLSRSVSQEKRHDMDLLERQLEAIRNSPTKPWWELTLGVAVGVATFCILFGGSLIDAMSTFAVGVFLGLFIGFVYPHMSRIVGNICGGLLGGLLCIGFYRMGFGQHLPNMIVGAIIALVPGVPFTNGIRDMANEDYIAGGTRLMDAFIAFLCIALGVCLALLLDGRLTDGMLQLHRPVEDAFTSRYPVQIAAAILGTVGFAVLFGTPRRSYWICGLVGAAGWVVYLLLLRLAGTDGMPLFSPVLAVFFAPFMVAVASQMAARLCKCAATVYLICGIIPLVPGGGIFWTAYYLVNEQFSMAFSAGFLALKLTVAIALGIILASSRLLKKLVFDKLV